MLASRRRKLGRKTRRAVNGEEGGPSLQKRFVKVEFLIEDVHAHSATALRTGAGKRQSVRGPGSRYDLVKLMRSRGAGAAASVTRIVSRHYCILVRLVVAAAICPPQASDTKAASMPRLAGVSYGQERGRIPLRVEQVGARKELLLLVFAGTAVWWWWF